MKDDFKIGDKIKVINKQDNSNLPIGLVLTIVDFQEIGNHLFVSLTSESGIVGIYEYQYLCTFVEKESTLKIEMGKKYRMVGTHEPVRVICVDRKVEDYSIYCVGLCLTEPNVESMVYFDHYGNNISGEQLIEEVPEVDWSKVQVDTLIWVDGIPRYFASSSKYYVYFFQDGCTSKTNTQHTAWAHKSNCSLEEPK